jgi:hypothetical protein
MTRNSNGAGDMPPRRRPWQGCHHAPCQTLTPFHRHQATERYPLALRKGSKG